ncbi:MAG: hypothetical protein IPG50_39745 [Myxococcales bacterium]|nr:hypothetical protein [Myxococcales bacterium]
MRSRLLFPSGLLALAALVLIHCDKKSEAPVAEKAAPQAASASPAAAPPAAPPSPSTAQQEPAPTAAVTPAPSASGALPAKTEKAGLAKLDVGKGDKDKNVPATAGSAAPATAAPTAPPVRFQHSTALYTLDASPPASCKAGAACEVVVRLEAKGAYHINKEYPYKLKAQPSDGVAFANTDGTFSKASGDFSQQGESVGLLKVRFTGQAPGQAKVRGVYKFSVCSESDCKLDQAEVAFETPIR